MQTVIRFAQTDDFQLVRKLDPHSKYIDPDKLRRKIEGDEVLIASADNVPVGLLKFSYFWTTRPYIDLVWVIEEQRGKGVGSQLLDFLEKYLSKNGYSYLYSSSEEAEEAPQQWHLKHGFKKCGVLSAINLPHDQTGEVFFYKHIGKLDPSQEKLRTYPV